MNKKRVFIAINLPKKIKDSLFSFRNQYSEIPARWTKKENLHITLFFIGYVSEKNMEKMKKAVEETVQIADSFELSFTQIVYGPLETRIPRMIWALVDNSKIFSNLKENIIKNVLDIKLENFRVERMDFLPHVTLARIKQMDFRRMDLDEIPKINETISLKFDVNSIEIMESQLKKTGAEYTILESYPFSRSS
jgi:RNA 2',3'-cyclic 3'-phosphodiesterase